MKEYKLEALCTSELPLVIQKLRKPYSHRSHQHNAVELVYIEHGAGWCAVTGIIHPMLTGDLYMIPVGATPDYFSQENYRVATLLCRDIVINYTLKLPFHIGKLVIVSCKKGFCADLL